MKIKVIQESEEFMKSKISVLFCWAILVSGLFLITSSGFGWVASGYCYFSDSTHQPVPGLQAVYAEISYPDPFDDYTLTTTTDSTGYFYLTGPDTYSPYIDVFAQNPNFGFCCDNYFYAPLILTTLNFYGSESFTTYDFLTSSDTTLWVVENISSGTSTTSPVLSWLPTYNNATGVIKIQFNGSNQRIKLTLQKANWYVPEIGNWYLVKSNIQSDTVTPNDLAATIVLFTGVPGNPTDIDGHALVSIGTTWVTLRSYQESLNSNTLYPQLIIASNDNPNATIYIDSIEVDEILAPSAQ